MDSRDYKTGGQGSAALLEPPGAQSERSAPGLQTIDERTPGIPYIAPGGTAQAPQAEYASQPPIEPAWQPVQQQRYVQQRSNTAVLVVLGALVLFGLMLVVAVGIATRAIFSFVDTAPVGDVRTENQIVQLGAADSVDVRVTMGVGNLAIRGGASDLMDAEFTYNVEQWKPEVSYAVNANSDTGNLLVKQPDLRVPTAGNVRYEWDLRFGGTAPLDLQVNMGAGDQDVSVNGLTLTKLEVTGGTGNTSVDLTGVAEQSFEARVINSVGNTTVKLPGDMGVKVTVVQGFGNVDANGLKVSGDTYTNDAYGKSDATINLYVETATGNITLEQSK